MRLFDPATMIEATDYAQAGGPPYLCPKHLRINLLMRDGQLWLVETDEELAALDRSLSSGPTLPRAAGVG